MQVQMPRTRVQGLVFGGLMSILMAYGMELYNVSIKLGGMSNQVFWPALKETGYMCLIVFAFSNLFGNRLGHKLATRHLSPGKDNPYLVVLMTGCCTVLVMCPAMSLVATVLFQGVDRGFLANWMATVAKNFPMALLWQLFFAGPVTRVLFRRIFRRQLAPAETAPAEG